MQPSREKNGDHRTSAQHNLVSRESEQAYQNAGMNRGHQEFAEILDNISSEHNSSMAVADPRNERAAYKNYIE